jgi:hypothetical protein
MICTHKYTEITQQYRKRKSHVVQCYWLDKLQVSLTSHRLCHSDKEIALLDSLYHLQFLFWWMSWIQSVLILRKLQFVLICNCSWDSQWLPATSIRRQYKTHLPAFLTTFKFFFTHTDIWKPHKPKFVIKRWNL